jgi:hypothetical protein
LVAACSPLHEKRRDEGANQMSTRKPDSEEPADLIITGRVGALRDLAAPAQLNDFQLKIIHWYEQLQQPLSGPRSGNERGPAQQPPWAKQGPRVQTVEVVAGEAGKLAYLLEGSGLGAATDVLIDGRAARGWQAVSSGRLLIPISDEVGSSGESEVEIEVRTPLGDIVVRADSPAGASLS